MGSSAIVESLFPCLETLVTNGDVDTVRVKAVTACGPMILNMDQRACTGTILPLMEALVTDRSWTIRHAAVNHFAALAGGVGPDTTRSVLTNAIQTMLDDPEGEVRKSCIQQVNAVLDAMGPGGAGTKEGCALIDSLTRLAEDEYAAVRLAVMDCAMKLLRSGNESVHELVMTFAESEEDETKLPVLADLAEIARNLPKSEVGTKLMPIIESILVGWKVGGREPQSQTIGGSDSGSNVSCVVIYPQDAGSSWRQRQKVIANMVGIGRHTGADSFTASLLPLLLVTLADPINAVRREVVLALASATKEFGMRWAIENLVGPLVDMMDDASAATVTTVPLLSAYAAVLDAEEPGASATEAALAFLPCVVQIASGTMNPTVAIASIPALGALARNLSAGDVSSRVMPLLEALCKDEEVDVSRRANAVVATM